MIEPDSVALTVKDLVKKLTKSSQEIPLAACSLLLSQKKDFINNHLPRIPCTPNQQWTMELRDEKLSSLGAQDRDRSVCHVSDLADVEFYWEIDQLDIDIDYRPGIDTPFSTTAFVALEMGAAEKPLLLDKEEVEEKSSSSTPVSERPTRLCALLRSRPVGTRIENVLGYVRGTSFNKYFCVCVSK